VATGPAVCVAAGLTLHGALSAWWMVRVSGRRGHGAWRNLYVLMMEAQVALALLYLLWPAA
jgi:hypothetical protein